MRYRPTANNNPIYVYHHSRPVHFHNFSTYLERGWTVISKEIQPDYIHLFFSIAPAIAAADTAKVLKGVTTRLLFQEFQRSKGRY